MNNGAWQAAPDRRRARPSRTVVGVAAAGAAAVAFVTLCPIGLRPHFASATLERLAAYAVLGALVSRAAGRRGLVATAWVVVLAFGLEAGQRLAPGRHAQFADGVVKAFGGVLGVAAAQLAYALRRALVRLAGLGEERWVAAPVYVTSR